MERLTLELIVANQYGVLNRITGLYARRGFNIHSLNVNPTEDDAVSRMIIESEADELTKNQMIRQIGKLFDVISVSQIKCEAV